MPEVKENLMGEGNHREGSRGEGAGGPGDRGEDAGGKCMFWDVVLAPNEPPKEPGHETRTPPSAPSPLDIH